MTEESEKPDPRIDWVRLLAHDLRAPLTALTASIGFLEQRHTDLESSYLLSAARDAVLRLTRIIDNVEVRGQILERVTPLSEQVDLAALVRTTAAEINTSLALREARLDIAIASEPIVIESDAQVLRIIVANALLNAIESSPLQGLVTLSLASDATGVRIEVTDQGSSIPADAGPEVLDDWGQLDLRRRAVRIGRGLTLVAVRLATEAIGGRALLAPAGASGCRLTVHLPHRVPQPR